MVGFGPDAGGAVLVVGVLLAAELVLPVALVAFEPQLDRTTAARAVAAVAASSRTDELMT
ncbi:hypothetical protein MMAD_47720 [Mycolicibacterium madagascariense]|uniref:Uncharacterized protein n=1 Tax=Mycolicibacterium madagascariense TaxID=212765 RepID=A0A7I7XMM9_9MYCO|nr:hypothetical protein MMAD_47720 [Mycolicibacterium madagascariense]